MCVQGACMPGHVSSVYVCAPACANNNLVSWRAGGHIGNPLRVFQVIWRQLPSSCLNSLLAHQPVSQCGAATPCVARWPRGRCGSSPESCALPPGAAVAPPQQASLSVTTIGCTRQGAGPGHRDEGSTGFSTVCMGKSHQPPKSHSPTRLQTGISVHTRRLSLLNSMSVGTRSVMRHRACTPPDPAHATSMQPRVIAAPRRNGCSCCNVSKVIPTTTCHHPGEHTHARIAAAIMHNAKTNRKAPILQVITGNRMHQSLGCGTSVTRQHRFWQLAPAGPAGETVTRRMATI